MAAARCPFRAVRDHEDNMKATASSFVSHERLNQRILDLARIGATESDGVNRQALSDEDAQAQAQLAEWGSQAGLIASRDPAGNLFLRLTGEDPDLPPVVSGSHLDSQPTGGKYDGAFGVLAALEAAQAIRDAGIRPLRSLDVVAWMNEEGSRFAPGMLGSSAFSGARTLDTVLAVEDAQGVSVRTALAQVDARLAHIARRPLGGHVHSYVEAHIEQGPELERHGVPVGVVTGIQGKHTFRITVHGEASHAGTSMRRDRKDALQTAVAVIAALGTRLHDAEDIVKFTVGRFDVTPNAPSVVPSKVVFSIDLRHPDSTTLLELSACVERVCNDHASPCRVEVERLSAAPSLTFPESMQERIRVAAERLGLPNLSLASAAGHDARYLHDICPSAMIFVPCKEGITHNEAEYSTPADLTAGTRVLTDVLVDLAQGGNP